MELVTGATNSLLPKLGALLQDEYNLQDKVKRDIESLQNELVFMNATLRMVAEVPRDQLDEHARIWAVFIKELSYDMEDVVSTFVARVQRARRLGGLITKVFNMLCMGRTHHEIAGMVQEIRSLIKEVADLRDRYRLDGIVTRPATATTTPTPTPAVVVPQRDTTWLFRYLADDHQEITTRQLIGVKHQEPVAVGVEEHMKLLHNWITSDDNYGSLLTIVGPTGVGKTTIAMALYRHYGDQFQLRAMVNVSRTTSNAKYAIMDILNQVKPPELQGHDGDIPKIQAELKDCLNGKRFLLLLDDLWCGTIFDSIIFLLLDIKAQVKLIATRQVDDFSRAHKGDYVHKVGLLSDEKAEQLFTQVVGGGNGKKIPPSPWGMCGGLPSAIVAMAGQVSCNPEKPYEEWGEACSAPRVSPSPSTSHTTYQLTRILSTCYNDMPVEIKTCSLYLSIFPRGQMISRKRLTRRWITDGFVVEQQGLSAEEVVETYLNHLVRRKILRAVELSSNGKVKSYQVHDTVLEYLVCKASEENFATTIGGWGMPPPSSKIRRLSIQYRGYEEMQVVNLSHVRDLTIFGSLKKLTSGSFKFRVVQVLDLEGCMDFKQHHTKEICRMLLLKYLSLRGTSVNKLTKRITNLRYLETLDIRETNVMELPKSFCNLERVVNILGGNKKTRKALKLPQGLGENNKMITLRILSGIEMDEGSCRSSSLWGLTNLTKLAIYRLINNQSGSVFDELKSVIRRLNAISLRTLVIHEDSSEFFKLLDDPPHRRNVLNALELSGKLVKLPNWVTEVEALKKITLSVTALRADNLEVLSKMCSLFSLTFSLNAAKQDEETDAIIEDNKACSDGGILFPVGGFENLKLLRFFAPCVPQLSLPDGATPALERLELRFSNFDGLVGIKGLTNLQEVHIRVHGEPNETTESLIKEMTTAARGDSEGPRIILY